MHLEQRIEEIIEPTVTDLGFEIVRVQLSGKHNPSLQIMAEPLVGSTMTVDDCAKISRAISAVMDVEDPISNEYTLEVSSPGLDRPLVKLRDFDRFAGFETRVEMAMPLENGRRRLIGRLNGIDGETVLMTVDDEELALPFCDIHRAKLLLTDELLAMAQKEKSPNEA